MASRFAPAEAAVQTARRQVGYRDVTLWSSDRLQDSRPVDLLKKGTNVEVMSRVRNGSVVEVRSETGAQGWLRAVELTWVWTSREAETDARLREPWPGRECDGAEGAAASDQIKVPEYTVATTDGSDERAAPISMDELASGSARAVIDGETFSFGTREGRIFGSAALLTGTVVGLALASGESALWSLAILGVAGWGLWELLVEAYEVHISAARTVTLTSVLRIVDFAAMDITALVRRECVSDRSLHSVRVECIGGSVNLPGREELFVSFKALNPSAPVRREEYDDTSD